MSLSEDVRSSFLKTMGIIGILEGVGKPIGENTSIEAELKGTDFEEIQKKFEDEVKEYENLSIFLEYLKELIVKEFKLLDELYNKKD